MDLILMANMLVDLVKYDRGCRNVGITETHTLNSQIPVSIASKIAKDKDSLWYGMPIMCAPAKFELDTALSAYVVFDRLKKHCPVLGVINPDYFTNNKLCIAGGAMIDVLNKEDRAPKDIDIFFTGVTQDEALVILNDILNKIACAYPYQLVSRNQHALNIKSSCDIQIMFRLYNNVSEVIHSFDLQSSAVAYSGNQIHFTKLSEYCIANAINVIDTTRRSKTYEFRLHKYFNKGFSIVFPEFDVKRLEYNKEYYFGDLVVSFLSNESARKSASTSAMAADIPSFSESAPEPAGYWNVCHVRPGCKSDYFNSSVQQSLIKIRNGFMPDIPELDISSFIKEMNGVMSEELKLHYIMLAKMCSSQVLVALRKRNNTLFTVTEEEYETITKDIKKTDFDAINNAIVKYVLSTIETNLSKMVADHRLLPIYWEQSGSQLIQYNPIREHPGKWYGDVYTPVFESRTDIIKTKLQDLALKYGIPASELESIHASLPVVHTY